MAIVFGLLFLHYSRLGAPIEGLLQQAIQPIQTRLYSASMSTQSAASTDLSSLTRDQLIARINDLILQNDQSSVRIAQLQSLVDDSKLLEEQVAFLQERSFHSVTARVTSRSTEQLSQSLMINKGSADGLQEGLPVITDQGVLIGTLRNVTDHSSEVLLLTSFDSRISSRVQNEAQSPGVVRGEHNLSLFMEYIPQIDVVAVGDMVVTNGADSLIPQGLVVGRVQEVFNAQGDLFQQASLAPVFSTTEVFIVSVLLP